ncbi:MAG: hypothetical protein NVSMB69_01660 [Novosphingobium sp.]
MEQSYKEPAAAEPYNKAAAAESYNKPAAAGSDDRGRKLERAGWGVALIWISTAIMLGLGWGAGLFGLGAIILGSQALRYLVPMPVDWFGAALGLCLCLLGLKSVLGIGFGEGALLPAVSIVLGAGLVISTLRRPRLK